MFALLSQLFSPYCRPHPGMQSPKHGNLPPPREHWMNGRNHSPSPQVTCPAGGGERPPSSSSNLPEKTRKCFEGRTRPSGRAVRAFVPPAAGLPRRR
ncbi:hypothetical protein MC885_020828 [Smutsia gigantea]|nr:hypothetical protein MC885_020828 [Smutsia gigantea]